MFAKNVYTNKRYDQKDDCMKNKKKEITMNMSDTINVVIRRRISNLEDTSDSLGYKTSFSPIHNNMFLNTNMQVDSYDNDTRVKSPPKGSTAKTEKSDAEKPISPPYLRDIVNMKYEDEDEMKRYFHSRTALDNVMSTFSSVDEQNLQNFRKKAAGGENLESGHVCSFLITILISLFCISLVLYNSTSCDGIERWPHHENGHVEIPERVEMFREYAEEVVPDLENFYVSSETKFSQMGSAAVNVSQRGPECVQYWIQQYHGVADEMFNVSYTSPQDVRLIVDFLGLSGVEGVERVLSTHLSTKVSTQSFFHSIEQCATQNQILNRVACDVMDDANLQLEFRRYAGHEEKWRLMFAFAVVLETLTSHALSDPTLYVALEM